MPKETFGYYCGVFSLAKSSNGILIPGSKNKPVYQSVFPYAEMDKLAGLYVMRASSNGSIICETLVRVLFVGHQSEPEPFLGIKPQGRDSEELREIFKPVIGKKVEFAFTSFKTYTSSNMERKPANTPKQTKEIKAEQSTSNKSTENQEARKTTHENSPEYIIREYIDFVNKQVGVYMDAIAGFAGHYARVERQVCRVLRKDKSKESNEKPVVWASYEDPSKPDVIHNRIMPSEDYLSANSVDGSNAQQHSQAILVFLYAYWEHEIRPRLTRSMNLKTTEIKSEIMYELKQIRHSILHTKGILRSDKHKNLNLLSEIFSVDQPIIVSYENMHKIFVLIKQDCARLFFKGTGMENSTILNLEKVRDIAIQRPKRS